MKPDTKTAHTAGPWHVGGKDATIVFPEDGYAIADAKTYHGKHHEGAAQANALLMAAAPDMKEALRKIAFKRKAGPTPRFVPGAIIEEIEAIALAAIAKAEGQS